MYNDKFKYCPQCGYIYDINSSNVWCAFCDKDSSNIGCLLGILFSKNPPDKRKIITSKHNYGYYIIKAHEKYNNKTMWRKIFYEEELFTNPYFNRDEFNGTHKPSYFNYCPVCGTNHNNTNISICTQCGSHIKLIRSMNDREYYRDKSIALYGNYYGWKTILIEEEASKNTLFDATKTEQNSPPAVIPVQVQHQQNTPKCPTCGSTNIKRISSLSKAAHGAAFGLLSTTARSQFECNNCKYKW